MEDSPPDTDFIDNADLIEAAALGEILTDGDREAGLPREEAASLLARTRIAEKRIHILNEIEEVILEISDDQELAEDPTEWELPNKVAKGLVIKKISNDIFTYFALAGGVVEAISIDILEKELIDEEFRGTGKTNKLLNRQMNQKMRNDLLLRTGIVDTGIHSKLSETRKARNKLSHDLTQLFDMDTIEDMIDTMDSAFEAINSLVRIYSEGNAVGLEFGPESFEN